VRELAEQYVDMGSITGGIQEKFYDPKNYSVYFGEITKMFSTFVPQLSVSLRVKYIGTSMSLTKLLLLYHLQIVLNFSDSPS
jgi:hypothetical protein